MKTPEGKVKDQVKSIIERIPSVYYFMPATGGYGRSGIPDIMGVVSGRAFAVECKANGGQLTALQNREIDKFVEAKGTAFVVDASSVGLFAIDFADFARHPDDYARGYRIVYNKKWEKDDETEKSE